MEHIRDLRQLINEARKLDDDEVEYTEKKAKGEVERVIATLKGHKSGSATRLAARYFEIKKLMDKLEDLRADENKRAKAVVEEFFDAEDKVLTRVLESIQFTLTINKQITKPATTKSSTNYEAVVNGLLELLPGLEDVLSQLIDEHTKVTEVPEKEPPLSLRVVKKESVNESHEKDYSNLFSKLDRYLDAYDSKLDELKRMI